MLRGYSFYCSFFQGCHAQRKRPHIINLKHWMLPFFDFKKRQKPGHLFQKLGRIVEGK